jgi:GDP-4-dehydro-6-deoxy-D-mannose reductase
LNYIITGASGFVAGHLIETIFAGDSEAKVTGIDLSKPDYFFLDRKFHDSVIFVKADLLNNDDILRVIERAEPHYIIHLAAYSSVAYSWQNPVISFNNNFNIFLNLLEAVKQFNPRIRVLSIGSSEQYGIVSADKIPLKETEAPNPISPYAVARVAQEYMASVYVKGFELDIVSTRSFNHFGPRQDERFVLSGFARQAAEIKKGIRKPVIHVGDLNVIRDFTDVRDVSKAYLSLLAKGMPGETYNVCSGIGRKIIDCLNLLIETAGIQCKVQKSEELMRPVDNPIIVGDNAKLKERTGWFSQTPFEITLHDLYEYWMSRI